MEKLKEINFKEQFEKIKDIILEHKVASIIVVSLTVIFIILLIINSMVSVKSLVVEFSNNDNIEMHYSPFTNDSAILSRNAKIEVNFTMTPKNKSSMMKCYYDKEIISYKNNTITPKKNGTTKFYCTIGFLTKTKSNVIDIEVK